jgi:hypothetical protein
LHFGAILFERAKIIEVLKNARGVNVRIGLSVLIEPLLIVPNGPLKIVRWNFRYFLYFPTHKVPKVPEVPNGFLKNIASLQGFAKQSRMRKG